jgi:TfoX/Sxy family transcriptional regulator of competence genes
MSSDQNFVEFIVEQMADAGNITYRKMFGEYGIYCHEKIVALICDNQLFIKPTESGKGFIGEVVEAPPYPGASLYFLIEDQFEEREWLSHLGKITAAELPMPKPKKKKDQCPLRS